ncbi:GIY-YIG nuclease family protein [bacterium]|nr:GIY-YIG nuclease family protein [bacterium]
MNRKDLINQYKQTVQPMGIYQIKNTANGKRFVGSAPNLQGRINRHKFQLEYGVHPNKELQQDFTASNGKSFVFKIIDYLEPKNEPGFDYSEELKLLERMWLEKLQPFAPSGYNERK